jgi:hypothetical protein
VYVRDRHSGEALRGLAAGGGRVVVIGFALAESAGVKIDKGGVATDAELRTSDPAIWAAGDIAYAHNPAAIGTSGSSTGAKPRPWVRSSVRTAPESISAGPSRPVAGQPSVIIN